MSMTPRRSGVRFRSPEVTGRPLFQAGIMVLRSLISARPRNRCMKLAKNAEPFLSPRRPSGADCRQQRVRRASDRPCPPRRCSWPRQARLAPLPRVPQLSVGLIVGGEGLGEDVAHLVGPSAVMFDDLVADLGHEWLLRRSNQSLEPSEKVAAKSGCNLLASSDGGQWSDGVMGIAIPRV